MDMTPEDLMMGEAVWTPKKIPGLLMWFDASQIAGLVDGNKVAQWNDLSGNNRHATQTTPDNQPIYKTNVLNGKPVVRFDGNNDNLTLGNLTCFHGLAGLTVVATVMFATDAYSVILSQHNASTNGVFFIGMNFVATGYQFTTINSTLNRINANPTPVLEVGQYIKVAYRYTGAVMQMFLNDVQKGNNVNQTGVLNNFGAPVSIGSINLLGQYMYGDIAEIVAYNRSLTDAELLLL